MGLWPPLLGRLTLPLTQSTCLCLPPLGRVEMRVEMLIHLAHQAVDRLYRAHAAAHCQGAQAGIVGDATAVMHERARRLAGS